MSGSACLAPSPRLDIHIGDIHIGITKNNEGGEGLGSDTGFLLPVYKFPCYNFYKFPCYN